MTDTMFHFTCFNVEDQHDPSVGLYHGELSIPGNLLRREVFDPVINEVRPLNPFRLKDIFYPTLCRIFAPMADFHGLSRFFN